MAVNSRITLAIEVKISSLVNSVTTQARLTSPMSAHIFNESIIVVGSLSVGSVVRRRSGIVCVGLLVRDDDEKRLLLSYDGS